MQRKTKKKEESGLVKEEKSSGDVFLLGIHISRLHARSNALQVEGLCSDDEQEEKDAANEEIKEKEEEKEVKQQHHAVEQEITEDCSVPASSSASSASSSRLSSATSSPSRGPISYNSTPPESGQSSDVENNEEERGMITNSTQAEFIYISDVLNLRGWSIEDLCSLSFSVSASSSSPSPSSSLTDIETVKPVPRSTHRMITRARATPQSRRKRKKRVDGELSVIVEGNERESGEL